MSTESSIEIQSSEQLKKFMDEENSFILYFSSEYCNVCNNVFPKLINLADNYPIKIAKIDLAKNLMIAGQFTVFTSPTILIFNQDKEILRNSRFVDFSKIEKTLETLSDH